MLNDAVAVSAQDTRRASSILLSLPMKRLANRRIGGEGVVFTAMEHQR